MVPGVLVVLELVVVVVGEEVVEVVEVVVVVVVLHRVAVLLLPLVGLRYRIHLRLLIQLVVSTQRLRNASYCDLSYVLAWP